LLSPEEAASYDSFDVCRSEYRALNYHYTDQYRGGYMLNYNFAVLAVSLAVLSIWLLYFESKDFVRTCFPRDGILDLPGEIYPTAAHPCKYQAGQRD